MKHLIAGILLILCVSTGVVAGHHSYGGYDLDNAVSIEGVLEVFEFKAPHALLRVRGDDTRLYTGEWTAPQALTRSGVGADTLVAGQRLVLGGFPKRDFAESGILTLRSVRRPADGWVFERQGGWGATLNQGTPPGSNR